MAEGLNIIAEERKLKGKSNSRTLRSQNLIPAVIYGAKDEKRGLSTLEHNILHPKTNIQGGILEKECAKLLSCFFKSKR